MSEIGENGLRSCNSTAQQISAAEDAAQNQNQNHNIFIALPGTYNLAFHVFASVTWIKDLHIDKKIAHDVDSRLTQHTTPSHT